MNFQENKLELGIAILIVVLMTGLFRVFAALNSQGTHQSLDITYEMPRPKTNDLVGEFTLGDREVERREVALQRVSEEAAAKKIAEAKKAAAEKAAKEAAKLAAAKKAAQAATQNKKPKVTMTVVPRADNHMTAAAPIFIPAPIGPSLVTLQKQDQNNNDDANGGGNPDNRSAAEWMQLLTTQPTQANMKALVAAVQKGQVNDEEFDRILDAMLKSKNPAANSTAFYGLSLDMTVQSFGFAVKETPSLTASEQATANQYTTSYFSKKPSVLVQAMAQADQTTAVKAGQILLTGLQSGTATSGVGPASGVGGVQTQSLAKWKPYLPVFQHLAQSNSDPALQTIAQGILAALNNQQQVASSI